MIDDDLQNIVMGHWALVQGGYEFNGVPLSNVDKQEIIAQCQIIRQKNIKQIVISGVFSPVLNDQEKLAEQIILKEYPEASITLSSSVAGMGLLERENASILNACLRPLAARTIIAFRKALSAINLDCPFYLTQNDGTLLSSGTAWQFPVNTVGSGPTNSIRGAAFLSHIKNAIVADIGGTSLDVGVLRNGFPRQSSIAVNIAGVRTNFRMPDTHSVALGGGSIVQRDQGRLVTIGPVSVGNEMNRAMVFGGDTLTMTDVAVAAGLVSDIGNPDLVKDLDSEFVQECLKKVREITEETIESMKTSSTDVPVLLVGGGSILIDTSQPALQGTNRTIKPPNFAIANAVGAAIAQVGGMVERSIDSQFREDALNSVKEEAIELAVRNGAKRDTVEIIDIEETPMAYSSVASIVKVKAVGDLDTERVVEYENLPETDLITEVSMAAPVQPEYRVARSLKPCIDVETYRPHVVDRIWTLSEIDVDFLSIGCSIMGTGGGGSTTPGVIMLNSYLRSGKKLTIIEPSALKHGDNIYSLGYMGAPTIAVEKLLSGKDGTLGINTLAQSTQRKPTALMSAEIGGVNGLIVFVFAAEADLPVIDADGFGRAFPELQMYCPFIYGEPPTPCSLSDEKGNSIVLSSVSPFNPHKNVEKFMRACVVEMGASGVLVFPPLSTEGVFAKSHLYTMSQSWWLGRAVRIAQKQRRDPVQVVKEYQTCLLLFKGKIVDVYKKLEGGFTRGVVTLEGLGEFKSQTMKVDIQNENLIARLVVGNQETVVASVPDLITLLNSVDGTGIYTEELRYGLRVSVLCLPPSPLLTTDTALSVIGPQAFGYRDVKYSPAVQDPVSKPRIRSVIEVYNQQ